MTYGVQPEGYVRKPISVVLAEIEAAMIAEFGPDTIQTAQSPLGQMNGLIADLIGELDELNLDLYQSYDPDQAEGTRLDTLGKVRLLARAGRGDQEFRQAMTNADAPRTGIVDIETALRGIHGVTYARVFLNEGGDTSADVLSPGTIAAAVTGGADGEIADVLARYIVPGVDTYGNVRASTDADGYCRSVFILRPSEVDVTLDITVEIGRVFGRCPAPSVLAIKEFLLSRWPEVRTNGTDLGPFAVRRIVETEFPQVRVVSVVAGRDGATLPVDQPVAIAFDEFAHLTDDGVTVVEAG